MSEDEYENNGEDEHDRGGDEDATESEPLASSEDRGIDEAASEDGGSESGDPAPEEEHSEGDNVVHVDFGARRRVDDSGGESEGAGEIEEVSGEDSLQSIVESAPRDPSDVAKLAVFRQFIEQGKVMVILDATRQGVRVPEPFSDEEQLRLNFSHKFHIDDFAYDERGVRASLSFGGEPFYCIVPWTAVLGLLNHENGSLVVFEGDGGL
jgi:hypothetical protein